MLFDNFVAAESTLLWGAFLIALVMGAVVNKTNFCTMGAVSDLVNMGDTVVLVTVVAVYTGQQMVESDGVADQLSFSSSRGPAIPPVEDTLKPNVIAPGTAIVAAGFQGSSFLTLSGTSMASPHVAGAAALIKSVQPDWGPSQLASTIEMTATTELARDENGDPATTEQVGAGRPQLGLAAQTLSICDPGDATTTVDLIDRNGYAGNVTLSRPSGHARRWQLSNVAVLDAYRGRGIGRKLVETAIERYGSEATGVSVAVGAVRISLRDGEGSIEDLVIGSPEGFRAASTFELGEIHIALDTATLDDIEEALIASDLGPEASSRIRKAIAARKFEQLDERGQELEGLLLDPDEVSVATERLRLQVSFKRAKPDDRCSCAK